MLNIGHFVRVWKHKDRILSVGELMVRKGGRVSVAQGRDLQISDIRKEDAGEYICEVDVHGEVEEVRHKLEIFDKLNTLLPSLHNPLPLYLAEPPAIPVPQHQTLAVAEGDDLVVSCQATGSPVPVLEWRQQMDGKVIGNLSEVSGDLVIPPMF